MTYGTVPVRPTVSMTARGCRPRRRCAVMGRRSFCVHRVHPGMFGQCELLGNCCRSRPSRPINEHGCAAAHIGPDHVEREIFFRVLLGHAVAGHQDVQTLRTVIDGDGGVELESQSNQGVFESIGEERAIVGCSDHHAFKYSTDVWGAGDVLLAVGSITR